MPTYLQFDTCQDLTLSRTGVTKGSGHGMKLKLIPCEQRIYMDYDHINKLCGENIYAERASDKIQHPFLEEKKKKN